MIKRARHRLPILIGAAAAALLLIIVASADEPTPQVAPNTLQSIGIRISPAPGVPKISEAGAIAAATAWAPGLPDQATSVTAQFVLFSDDNNFRPLPGGGTEYLIQQLPAWLVTFQGLAMPPNIGKGPLNTELNVVIDASTGEFVEAFSYR